MQELLWRGEQPHLQTDGADEILQRRAHGWVIVYDEDHTGYLGGLAASQRAQEAALVTIAPRG